MNTIAINLFHHAAKILIEKLLSLLLRPQTHADLAAAPTFSAPNSKQVSGRNWCTAGLAHDMADTYRPRIMEKHLTTRTKTVWRWQFTRNATPNCTPGRKTGLFLHRHKLFCGVYKQPAVEIFVTEFGKPVSIGPAWPIACNG